jgi:hypothetical protein
MLAWEYKVVQLKDVRVAESDLNNIGIDGWELIQVWGNWAILKKQRTHLNISK